MKKIFDVFAKGKNQMKKIEQLKEIVADYREKNSLVISELISLGFKVNQKNLQIGDYVVGNVIIERKTVSDFISSMVNKRIIRQLEALSKEENKLLMVEGIGEQELYIDSEEKIGVHPNSIRGFLLSILLNYKVPVIFTKNYEDSARFISLLARKKENKLSLRFKRKGLSEKEQLRFILESFPGVGPKTSEKILKKFKNVKKFINAKEKQLKEVLGKKAEAIIKTINQDY